MHLDADTLTFHLQAKSAYLPSVKQLQAPMFLSENTNGSVNREAPWGPIVCCTAETAQKRERSPGCHIDQGS